MIAGALTFMNKLKERQEESVTERLKLFALKNISPAKLANFSQITETSLFGKHEYPDYKILADLFYMQTRKHLLSRNVCNASSSLENMDTQSCFSI